MPFTVRAPNADHSGVSAGVRFTAGVGQTDSRRALAYFQRAGYTITSESTPDPDPEPEPVPIPVPGPIRPPRRVSPRKPAP